ncbi:MAG: c-type cytochrome, partial [Planctomycetales bacterium]|nr:c-type cytochrome [Planctomycetales bacterium]
ASSKDEFHRGADDPTPDPALQSQILASLNRIDWDAIDRNDRIDLLRTYQLVFTRLGSPDDTMKKTLATRLSPHFPAPIRELNVLLSNLLVYLDAPTAASKVVAQIRDSQSQEEQVDYALALRALDSGWTPELREEFFRWFVERSGSFRGGNSFNNALRSIQSDAAGKLTKEEYAALASIIEATPQQSSPQEILAARPVVREWKLDELVPAVETGLQSGGRDYDQGRRAFAAVACATCHRFANEGGAIGPDLTNVIGRFSVRDLLESIVHPSKVISDQYGAITIVTTDGRVVTGRIGNMNGNSINIVEDMFNAGRLTGIDRDDVESIQPSPISMMPEGLLNTLTAEEIQDLVAYLYSRGTPDHEMFQETGSE